MATQALPASVYVDVDGQVHASDGTGTRRVLSPISYAGGTSFEQAAQQYVFGAQPFEIIDIDPAADLASGRLVAAWGTTLTTTQLATQQSGALYIAGGSTGDNYLQVKGSGATQAGVSAGGQFPQMQNPSTLPWMIRAYTMLNPVDVAGASGNGTIYLGGWSCATAKGTRPTNGSGAGAPSRGVYGGFGAMVYRKGKLQLLTDLSIAPAITTVDLPFSLETVPLGHAFTLASDGAYIYFGVDDAPPTQVTDHTLGMPQAGSFLLFGTDSGGQDSSFGGYGQYLASIRVAVPARTL